MVRRYYIYEGGKAIVSFTPTSLISTAPNPETYQGIAEILQGRLPGTGYLGSVGTVNTKWSTFSGIFCPPHWIPLCSIENWEIVRIED